MGSRGQGLKWSSEMRKNHKEDIGDVERMLKGLIKSFPPEVNLSMTEENKYLSARDAGGAFGATPASGQGSVYDRNP